MGRTSTINTSIVKREDGQLTPMVGGDAINIGSEILNI